MQQDFAARLFGSEVVKRQRFFSVVDQRHGFADVVEGEHRQDRTEDLLLHHGRAGVDLREQRRLDIAVGGVGAAPDKDFPLREITRYAPESPVVDQPTVVGALLRVVAVKPMQGAGEGSGELVLQRSVDQQVVGCDAGLPGVEGLAPGDAARRDLDVGASVHDRGAFAAQFQHDGREVAGRGGHHDPSQRGASREEDHVPAHAEQQGVDLAAALRDGDILLVEDLGDHPLEDLGDVRGVGRGFQQGGAARRDGSDQRVEQQLHGVVPRCDDKRLPERLGENAAFRRQEFQRRRTAFGTHPFAEVAQVAADFAPDDADFGEVSLLGGFVQVRPQGVAEAFLPVRERRVQTPEHRAAERLGERRSRAEVGFLGRREGRNACGRGVFEGHGPLFWGCDGTLQSRCHTPRRGYFSRKMFR